MALLAATALGFTFFVGGVLFASWVLREDRAAVRAAETRVAGRERALAVAQQEHRACLDSLAKNLTVNVLGEIRARQVRDDAVVPMRGRPQQRRRG